MAFTLACVNASACCLNCILRLSRRDMCTRAEAFSNSFAHAPLMACSLPAFMYCCTVHLNSLSSPSPPGHKRRLEERDPRRRLQVRGRHGTNSLTDPPAAAVRPARAPAPSGPIPPLLPPQSARSSSRAPRRRALRKMRW